MSGDSLRPGGRSFARGPLLACAILAACAKDELVSLRPEPNPFDASDPAWTPQPHRDRPRAACVSKSQDKAWVMLAGTEDSPGTDVAVVDLEARKVIERVTLAPSPWSCALDPSGRHLVVTLRYSDHAIVLDAETNREEARIRVPFYTESAIWHPSGGRVFLANRWKDSVIRWDVGPNLEIATPSTDGIPPEDPMGVRTGDNPGPLAITEDGRKLFVGSVAGGSISVFDGITGEPIDVDGDPSTTSRGADSGVSWIELVSPIGGLVISGKYLYVADIGRGLGQLADRGTDLDEDGHPGDGTGNVIFQDLQNELGVIDTETYREIDRYTSDTICCRDFRDVDPDLPTRGELLPAPDTWTSSAAKSLPPKDRWIVRGALPEAMFVDGGRLWVAFAGSNEVQGFELHADGRLSELAGPLLTTGYNPKAIAGFRGKLLTVDRLAEAVSILDPTRGPESRVSVLVGDTRGGPFPATDVELGEAINEMTAVFTVDGDQTCVHCHRDNGAIARPIVMPLQESREWGARNVMAQRGLYDTRPWFFESSMSEENFFPVLNEFARKENFCCEELDPVIWSKYPTPVECAASPDRAGCNHVMRCESDPPPECGRRPYGSEHKRRPEFIRAAARTLLGRDTTIGDALWIESSDGTRKPIPLDFEGITRAVGLFMLSTPRLLPNPNAHLKLPSLRRGRALFEEPSVGCGFCHPLPRTTNATRPALFAPFRTPIRFAPVISPSRAPDGADASRVTAGFITTFPETVQGPQGLHFGSTPLRGLWDRPSTRFFHDGRGRSLRESLAPPGHPILQPGDIGRNERDGVFDTHGGTSHLSRWQLEDLMSFVLSL
ncbi:MAG: YncE family protein [Deltaproteobacteria bacterium]|nr:YncE family protein [Deltaproteobacteria bacterium]